MELLLAAHPALLSRDEMCREVGSQHETDDALAYFCRLGLAHWLTDPSGDFVFSTRTAMAAEEACTAPTVEGHALKMSAVRGTGDQTVSAVPSSGW